jgi:hypothetical protein
MDGDVAVGDPFTFDYPINCNNLQRPHVAEENLIMFFIAGAVAAAVVVILLLCLHFRSSAHKARQTGKVEVKVRRPDGSVEVRMRWPAVTPWCIVFPVVASRHLTPKTALCVRLRLTQTYERKMVTQKDREARRKAREKQRAKKKKHVAKKRTR